MNLDQIPRSDGVMLEARDNDWIAFAYSRVIPKP